MQSDYQPTLICDVCGVTPNDPLAWCCDVCGGILEIANLPKFDVKSINQADWSLWRYESMLPTPKHITLGEGVTPLVKTQLNGHTFYAKCEYLNPTGSYKDRGVAVMMNHLAEHGAKNLAEESSGNAGASVALYASAGGMQARIFSPASAPRGKQRQMNMGGEVVLVEGTKDDVNRARADAVDAGAVYASHSYSPFFVAGLMTGAWEIWEQLGHQVPDALAVPIGQGGGLLGFYRGFKAMQEAGVIATIPRIFGIQTRACDPIVQAWERGLDVPEKVIAGTTVADGIVIPLPVRGKAVLSALRESNGGAFRVEEEMILPARDALAKQGLYVEPTSATTIAVLDEIFAQLDDDAMLVVSLTGNGLKAG